MIVPSNKIHSNANLKGVYCISVATIKCAPFADTVMLRLNKESRDLIKFKFNYKPAIKQDRLLEMNFLDENIYQMIIKDIEIARTLIKY